jgi:hypothetical protein
VSGPQLELAATKVSRNAREAAAGNKRVVSIRLSTRKLAALERIAEKRNEQHAWRRVKRSELIEIAVDELILREGDDA